jgi:thioredoxin-related protein
MGLLVAFWLGLTGGVATADTGLLPAAPVAEDGMHKQAWFHVSFLDLAEDLAEAAASGKRLVIMWEQRGCPYCARVHEVNLRIPEIAETVTSGFVVLQLNLWGDREVTDFDGQVLPEKKLAAKYGIQYTPTIQFFPETLEKVKGKEGREREVHRLTGYLYPFHFLTTFEYVRDRAYESQPSLQRYLSDRARALQAKGVEIDLMADHLPGLPEEPAARGSGQPAP